jgi:hypothetical protein
MYNSATKESGEKIAIKFKATKSDKDDMMQKMVTSDEKIFQTDGINSKTSHRKSEIKIGTRPQYYRKLPEPASMFFHANRKLFDSNRIDLDKAIIINGCYDTNKVTLERTAVSQIGDTFET